jgi:hypothetical protein
LVPKPDHRHASRVRRQRLLIGFAAVCLVIGVWLAAQSDFWTAAPHSETAPTAAPPSERLPRFALEELADEAMGQSMSQFRDELQRLDEDVAELWQDSIQPVPEMNESR